LSREESDIDDPGLGVSPDENPVYGVITHITSSPPPGKSLDSARILDQTRRVVHKTDEGFAVLMLSILGGVDYELF
jgi:hypothetical protein